MDNDNWYLNIAPKKTGSRWSGFFDLLRLAKRAEQLNSIEKINRTITQDAFMKESLVNGGGL